MCSFHESMKACGSWTDHALSFCYCKQNICLQTTPVYIWKFCKHRSNWCWRWKRAQWLQDDTMAKHTSNHQWKAVKLWIDLKRATHAIQLKHPTELEVFSKQEFKKRIRFYNLLPAHKDLFIHLFSQFRGTCFVTAAKLWLLKDTHQHTHIHSTVRNN